MSETKNENADSRVQLWDRPTDALVARLYAALKHAKSCTCGECSHGLNAVDALARRATEAEQQRDVLMDETWNAYAILGCDTDGDEKWHCSPEMAARAIRYACEDAREDMDKQGEREKELEDALAAIAAPDELVDANEVAFSVHAFRRVQQIAANALARAART